MKFSEDTDLSKIIGNFTKNDNYYKIEYLDGSVAEYYNSDDKHDKILMNRMLKDAIERDKNLYKKYKKYLINDIIKFLGTVYLLNLSRQIQLLYCLSFILNVISIVQFRKNLRNYLELKKYHDFLNIKNELEKNENKDITKLIEIDNFFKEDLNINNLDNYSNADLSLLKKELKQRKSN